MIIQNSTDIKTELFYDSNGDIAPIDVQYEKQTINPNGLVQLQKIPTIHTNFDVKGKSGINVIRYNKADVILNETDFTVDYQNGILTFHSTQKGKEVQISYTNAIGRLSVSADRVFANLDSQGNVVKTLQKVIDDGSVALKGLDTLGGAVKVVQQTQANIDSIKGLTGSIIEGSNIKTSLDNSNTTARTTDTVLKSSIGNANNKIQEMTEWVNKNGDVVNINNRVTTAEGKLNTVSASLADIETRFKGKKYVAIGDSITVGFVDKPYATLVGEVLDMAVINLGVSGSSIAQNTNSPDHIVNRISTIIPSDVDIISIFAGTNDFGHGSFSGHYGVDGNNTMYGAMKTILEYVLQNYPNAQLFWITPLPRETMMTENAVGLVLEDYRNIIADMCNEYGVPVLDFTHDGSINPRIASHKTLYATDGLHPLQKGHNIISKKIINFIRKL